MTTTTSRDTAIVATPRDDQATIQSRPAKPQAWISIGRVTHAELIKLLTVRSSYSALLTTVLALIGIGAFTAFGATLQRTAPGGEAAVDPTGGALTGVNLAVYIVAALGVLAVTSEYSTGTIKATLAAVPNRSILVWAKVLAVASTVLLVALPSTVIAFFAADAVLATAGIKVSLAEPGVLRAVVGAALYLSAVALFASGLGWLLRSTAGALATLFGILVILPVAAYLLPARLRDDVMRYLPDSAGMAILQTAPGPAQLAPWTGFGVFTAYTAITLIAAALVLRRRDT